MNKVDLLNLFDSLKYEDYVVIKPPETFDTYSFGSDIDIFCPVSGSLVDKAVAFLSKYVDSNRKLRISTDKTKIYIDLYSSNKIELRLDIYTSIPKYKNIQINDFYFYSVINNRVLCENKENKVIYVVSPIDDLVLRYIEYHEWISARPDKIKHIDKILHAFINDPDIQELFYQRLHKYISFGIPEYKSPSRIYFYRRQIKYFIDIPSRIINGLRRHGAKNFIKLLLERFRIKYK